MNRREFLLGAAGSAGLTAVLGTGRAAAQNNSREKSIAAWKKRIDEILGRGRLPIIDLQATYVAGQTNVPRMIEHMKSLDIAQIAFAAANAPNAAPSLELHRKHPELFIPTTNSGEFPRWWKGPIQFLAVAEKDLQSGDYFFMGEHEFRHLPSSEQVAAGRTDRDITIDLAGPAGHRLFQLSEKYGVAFQIHYEIEDALLPALEAMLARYPKAKVIWCHLAQIRHPELAKKYGPDYVGSLIERFPGVHFDLAVAQAGHIYKPTGARDSTLFTPSGALEPAWRAVLNKFPERFLSSSDYRPPIEQHYADNIQRQRYILGELSAAARQRVAFGNAWRLISGSDWA